MGGLWLGGGAWVHPQHRAGPLHADRPFVVLCVSHDSLLKVVASTTELPSCGLGEFSF